MSSVQTPTASTSMSCCEKIKDYLRNNSWIKTALDIAALALTVIGLGSLIFAALVTAVYTTPLLITGAALFASGLAVSRLARCLFAPSGPEEGREAAEPAVQPQLVPLEEEPSVDEDQNDLESLAEDPASLMHHPGVAELRAQASPPIAPEQPTVVASQDADPLLPRPVIQSPATEAAELAARANQAKAFFFRPPSPASRSRSPEPAASEAAAASPSPTELLADAEDLIAVLRERATEETETPAFEEADSDAES